MLRVTKISVLQFKNYSQREFPVENSLVGIAGPNGIGKTNLLDALYYACFTRSYFTKSDQMVVQKGQSGFRLEVVFEKEGQQNTVTAILRENGKKEFLVDGIPYSRISQHIGLFPAIMIGPDDIQIITEGSEVRRSYLDSLISQMNGSYLQDLIDYNKLMSQRNSLLKQFAETRTWNEALLDVYTEQLSPLGDRIFSTRKEVLGTLIPTIGKLYESIAGKDEGLTLQYSSLLHSKSMRSLLAENLEKDRMLQRTSQGIHRDDIITTLFDEPFKNIASQGQRKSLLFAFKLAAFEYLKSQKGFSPLLLLDDVFEKLDAERMHNLLVQVSAGTETQIIITDTHAERIKTHFNQLNRDFQLIEMK